MTEFFILLHSLFKYPARLTVYVQIIIPMPIVKVFDLSRNITRTLLGENLLMALDITPGFVVLMKLATKTKACPVLNNKNTNNVETHSCNILLLVYLGLSIIRCWEAIQHMRYLREYSNQRDKNIKKVQWFVLLFMF